jgi:hypothetical protein
LRASSSWYSVAWKLGSGLHAAGVCHIHVPGGA